MTDPARALDSLRAAIAAPPVAGKVVLSAFLPGLGPPASVWASVLNTDALAIEGAVSPAPAGTGPIEIAGMLDVLTGPEAVTVKLFQPAGSTDDSEVECLVIWNAAPDGWSPAGAYLKPPGGSVADTLSQALLRGLAIDGARRIFSSFDFTQNAAAAQMPGLLPDWLGGKAPSAGLTVMGGLRLPAAVTDLLKPLVDISGALAITGNIDVAVDDLQLSVSHEFDPASPPSVKPFGGGPTASLKALAFTFPIDGWGMALAAARLDGALIGEDVGMDVSFSVDLVQSQAVLNATAAEGKAAPSLGWAVSSLGIPGGAPALPFGIADITLAEVGGTFDLGGKGLTAYEAEFSTTKPVTLFGGVISFQPSVFIDVQRGDAPTTDVELFGLWTLDTDGGSNIETLTDVTSGDICARLAEGSRLQLPDFVKKELPDFLLADITILDLDLNGNHKAGTFSVTLETLGTLGLRIEGKTFGVEDIGFAMAYDGTAYATSGHGMLDMFGASIGVRFRIGGGAVSLSFSLASLNLSELAETFLSALGASSDLGDLALADLYLTLQRPGSDQHPWFFTVGARLDAPLTIGGSSSWALEDAAFNASRDADGPTAAFTGHLRLAGVAIAVSADFGAETIFKGAIEQTISIDAIAADLASQLQVTLPSCVKTGISFSKIAVTSWSKSGRLLLECDGILQVDGAPLVIHLVLDVAGGKVTVSGTLAIGRQNFSLTVASADDQTSLTASWTGRATFSDMISGLGLGADAIGIPSDLEPTFTAATFKWDGSAIALKVTADGLGEGVVASVADGSSRTYALGLTVARDIDLTNLPQIGTAVGPDERLAVKGVHLLWNGKVTSATAAKALNAVLPADMAKLAEAPSDGAIQFAAALDIAGKQQNVSLPLPTAQAPTQAPAAAAPAAVAAAAGPPTPSAGFSKWFSIGRTFGPVEVRRLGMRYRSGELALLLDASLVAGGFELGLKGLAIGSSLKSFSPTVGLDGLELAISEGALEVAGFFAKGDAVPPDFSYLGGMVLSLTDFKLTGIGSYARKGGDTSMFLWARVDTPIGGPPYFYVTGLLGGFGYNSDLRLPAPDQVHAFPLVAGMSKPGLVGGGSTDPMTVLSSLLEPGSDGSPPWIAIKSGQNWVSAGLQFNSFKMVDTNAIVVIEFGDELKLRLIGLSTLLLPRGADSPYAYAELQIEADVDIDQGTAGLTAILSSNSYVIDPACHLTGGFAFRTWWKGEYEGDFVITLGGYHPSFTPPARYPQVPRLGCLWKVDDHLTISGSAYFALTPSAAMAGGALAVVYQLGDLKAWLTAHADLLIEWKPFHFEASIGISVGVSYRLNLLFTSTTITLEVGADLDLWGPPTGGSLTVHCWVVSFTIDFGEDRRAPEACGDWSAFQKLLPRPDAFCITAATGGLLSATQDGALWVVRGDLFSFDTESTAPASSLRLARPATAAEQATPPTAPIETEHEAGARPDIRPMGLSAVSSDHILRIQRNDADEPVDLVAEGWSLVSRRRNVAAKLWSLKSADGVPPPDDPNVSGRLVGLSVAPPRPKLGAQVGPVREADLAYEDIADPAAIAGPGSEPARSIPAAAPAWVAQIAAGIASPAASARRTAILAGMTAAGMTLETRDGTGGTVASWNGPLDRFVPGLATVFRTSPSIAA